MDNQLHLLLLRVVRPGPEDLFTLNFLKAVEKGMKKVVLVVIVLETEEKKQQAKNLAPHPFPLLYLQYFL